MKVGDIIKLRGNMNSSYERQGELGILLEMINIADRSGFPEAEFGRVMWFKDGGIKLTKSKHLSIIPNKQQCEVPIGER